MALPTVQGRAVPRRDRLTILIGLGGVTLLAWLYLVIASGHMATMPGMSMEDMAGMMELRPWTGFDFFLLFLMWAIMMVGMMVPTAAPVTLIYAAVARRAASQASPIASTAIFVAGYLAIWTLFSAGATLIQWALEQAALLSPMMVSTSPLLGAGLLIAAGIYQFTPLKNTCLTHCRAPAHFLSGHWRNGAMGAFRMGLEHGAYCLGCCWALMFLLFLGGVMNLLWVAAIAVFVLLEKIAPCGDRGGRAAGAAMILLGLVMLVGLGRA